MNNHQTRRGFVRSLAAFAATAALTTSRAFARGVPDHPAPRPGITGKNVLTREQLASTPDVIPLFDGIREIPEIADGIRCNCGCPNPPEFRSLLSCFEGKGMARDCVVCQGQARLAIRMHKEGKTLDEIRAGIDAKFA
jgi:hypothetical protein